MAKQRPYAKKKRVAEPPLTAGALAADSSPTLSWFDQAVQNIQADLPDALMVLVVEVATGRCLASRTVSSSDNAQQLAEYSAEVVRQKQVAMATLGLDNQHLHEILVTTSTQHHLFRLLEEGRQFVFLAIRVQNTNLALAREILCTHVTTTA